MSSSLQVWDEISPVTRIFMTFKSFIYFVWMVYVCGFVCATACMHARSEELVFFFH